MMMTLTTPIIIDDTMIVMIHYLSLPLAVVGVGVAVGVGVRHRSNLGVGEPSNLDGKKVLIKT